jgi:hypothetical protein
MELLATDPLLPVRIVTGIAFAEITPLAEDAVRDKRTNGLLPPGT